MAEEIVLTERNAPRPSLQDELTRLYSQGVLTDITLSTEDGKNFEAHRILLAARSHYFHSKLPQLKPDPVIFLKGVKGAHLDKILKYIYAGTVSLSRHQLKPILEVAKSLQVKGLYDANPADILSRQGQASPSIRPPTNPSVAAAMAARAQHQQQRLLATQQVTFKQPLNVRTSRSVIKRPLANGGTTNKDSDDNEGSKKEDEESDDDDDEEDEDVEEVEEKRPRSASPPKPKRRRGRPPKNKKNTTTEVQQSEDLKKDDPYEFDVDESGATGNDEDEEPKPKGWRVGKKKKDGESSSSGEKVKHDEDLNDDESLSLATRRERANKYTTAAINGKQVLTVKCKNQTAELHLSRFANGIRGNSIKYKDQWMTPQEFESACGSTGKKYLDSIQTDYGPLKTLTASGMLKPHSRKCRCSICRGEETSPKTDLRLKRSSKRQTAAASSDMEDDLDEVQEVHEEEVQEVDDTDADQYQLQETEDPVLQQKDTSSKEVRGSAKRKKKKHKVDDWRKQIADQLKQEMANANANANNIVMEENHLQQQHIHHQEMPTISQMQHQQQQQQQPEMQYVTMSMMGGGVTISDMPPKISPPAAMLSDRIEPPQHAQPPTFYVMSPHPHMAPATPQHNPFAAMAPAPPLAPSVMTPQLSSPKLGSNNSSTTTTSSSMPNNNGGGKDSTVSRIGSVLNVRCKSTTALLYSNKYESGSKGKCIQLADEWLTPNEFEDRAGSKAKKYLSSIKCMGRPLRVYVNSGDLKGVGPPPAPKMPKKIKHNSMQPIAPAPQQQQQHMIAAPPTPNHMSSAPPLPPNLNMMMGAHNQPPILINQTSMASTMLGNQQILTAPMTFTLAQPMEVRQNVSQAM